jgi:alpha-L-fucosidase 2
MNGFMKLLRRISPGLGLLFLLACAPTEPAIVFGEHDLRAQSMPRSWDEGLPLGNGLIGALIWQKDSALRLSLDRADLWDLRPMPHMYDTAYDFNWVREMWRQNRYEEVQKRYDLPYEEAAGPSKIPAGALEFTLKADSARLSVENAVAVVYLKGGMKLEFFVHALRPIGWFRFSGAGQPEFPELIPPPYGKEPSGDAANSTVGQSLSRLGYTEAIPVLEPDSIDYVQEGWGGFKYRIHVRWTRDGGDLTGCWSITESDGESRGEATADLQTRQALQRGYRSDLAEHLAWWEDFWSRSAIDLPDSVLERQWHLEMYKFGAAARSGAPPISLQSVWTADNGLLPPWKGDFHHDLNTQLSYWPAYSGNHLDLAEGFVDWLWSVRDESKRFTRWFYGTEGLNVPGVTTLRGEPMGGWIQYSLGPTTSAWLGHHFYLQWKYSMDSAFLREKAYPWIRETAVHLIGLSEKDEKGRRKLPLSSSPEIFNNSREAWFENLTNYDLAMVRWTLATAAELATVLGLPEEARQWQAALGEWPDFAVDSTGFLFAEGVPYSESHRHFSHLVAYHPLSLVDWSNGEEDQRLIRATLARLDTIGPDFWCGYSWAWLGNLRARALDGGGAAEALRIFSKAFCLPNSFHVNGDQSGLGYSTMTYRPFTLEGNFACAAGIQEMLLQSHTGVIRIFPAIPGGWSDVSFADLRAEGAFLVSARRTGGRLEEVLIHAEKGGVVRLDNPFGDQEFTARIAGKAAGVGSGRPLEYSLLPGQTLRLQTKAP